MAFFACVFAGKDYRSQLIAMSDDSPRCVRNPSPPPELQQNVELFEADVIHNTTFSKHWLFSTLMKLIEVVEKEQSNSDDAEFVFDIDDEMQNELCKLWDMSMNMEVARFLQEFKAIDILVGVIGKSRAPRVSEICVGILGNMACDKDLCITMSQNDKLRNLVMLLLENRDAQTLNETTRLLYTSLSNPEAKPPWIATVAKSESIQEHIKFIFMSSTNLDLLKNTAELVDILLDLEEELCETWATTDFIHALLEAIKQIGCGHSEALEIYLHIFQLLSTTEAGVESLVSCANELEQPLMKYLGVVCEDEIVGLEGREACLASAMSVLNVIFSAQEDMANRLIKDEKLLRIFLKVLEPLYPWLQRLDSTKEKENSEEKDHSEENSHCQPSSSSDSSSNHDSHKSNSTNQSTTDFPTSSTSVSMETKQDNTAEDEKLRRHLRLLYNIVKGFVYDYMFTIHMISSEGDSEEEKEDAKSDSQERLFSHILSYLNSSCSRPRINYLILTLQDSMTEEFDPVAMLLHLANQHDQSRLLRIINDVKSGQSLSREDSNNDPAE